jgi:hypothetical protein
MITSGIVLSSILNSYAGGGDICITCGMASSQAPQPSLVQFANEVTSDIKIFSNTRGQSAPYADFTYLPDPMAGMNWTYQVKPEWMAPYQPTLLGLDHAYLNLIHPYQNMLPLGYANYRNFNSAHALPNLLQSAHMFHFPM